LKVATGKESAAKKFALRSSSSRPSLSVLMLAVLIVASIDPPERSVPFDVIDTSKSVNLPVTSEMSMWVTVNSMRLCERSSFQASCERSGQAQRRLRSGNSRVFFMIGFRPF
jgi:hypothetical protein